MARRRVAASDPSRVVGLVRVSTTEQADSGLGLDAQRVAITSECERRGWTLVEMVEEAGFSAKTLDRPGMTRALELLRSWEAGALVVAKLDRATRSVIDVARLLEQSKREGWSFVALDIGLDPGTPNGELFAHIVGGVAQWERRTIGQRTKDALAAKKAAGVRLGRPAVISESIRARILDAQAAGLGWSAIARSLNEDKVPTAHGGTQWYPSTVRAVFRASQALCGI